MSKYVIINRYPAFAKWVKREGIVDESTPWITTATPTDVFGKHVVGTIPIYLGVLAETVTEYPVIVPPKMRHKKLKLTVDEIAKYVREPVTYRVEVVER